MTADGSVDSFNFREIFGRGFDAELTCVDESLRLGVLGGVLERAITTEMLARAFTERSATLADGAAGTRGQDKKPVDDVVGGSHDVAFAGTLRRPAFVRVEMQGQGVLLALPCAGMN